MSSAWTTGRRPAKEDSDEHGDVWVKSHIDIERHNIFHWSIVTADMAWRKPPTTPVPSAGGGISTQWIYDRRPTRGDFGLHGLVWLWSRVNARALLCPYEIAKSTGCPWAPGHQPAPTAAPSPAPEPIDAEFFPPKEIPEPIRTGACPFYVLVVSDEAAGKPGGRPIVWEHRMPEGTTLQAALHQQQRVGSRYGTTYLAECRIIPELIRHAG